MKIAIPVNLGTLAQHFGHASQFAILEADRATGKVTGREDVDAPPHQPGLLPGWLKQLGADVIIASGMGQRARQMFDAGGIEVVVGAPSHSPEQVAEAWLAGELTVSENACDH